MAPAPDPLPAVDARDLLKRYGSVVAVAGVSLRVEAGSCLGLLGPNGAGKSTLLRLLGGLARPDGGSVSLAGRPVVAEELGWRRILGFVGEDLGLWEGLTAWEHLVLAGRLHGLEEEEARQRADDLLVMLDATAQADTMAGEASHGTRKKIALGMALLPSPRVLLLDEPFEGLDPEAAGALRDVLVRFRAGGGACLFASHVLAHVSRVCDRVVVLSEGRVAATLERDEWIDDATLEGRYLAAVGRRAEPGTLPWLR